MICSKKYLRNVALALSIPAIIVACAKAPENPGQADTATFVVEPVTATASEHQSKDSWNLERKDLLTLHACVKDIAYLEPVVGQTFVIRKGDQELSVTTDSKGCLNWNESLDFDYLAPETYVQQERTFMATRPHRGNQLISLALNPWRTDATALVDLRFSNVPRLATGENSVNALSSARLRASSAITGASQGISELVAEEMGVEFVQTASSREGADLHMHLMLRPKITRQQLDGIWRPEALKTGSIKISIAVIERLGDARSVLAKEELEGDIQSAILDFQDQLHLTRLPQKNALLEMAYRLEATGTTSSIRPAEGFVQLPGVVVSAGLKTQRLNVPFTTYLGGDTTEGESELQAQGATMVPSSTGNVCSDGSNDFGFYFSDWKIEYGGVLKTTRNENVPIEIGVNVNVCLKNVLDTKSVAGQPVNVQLLEANGEEGPVSTRTTDPQGCLFWTERLRFDYFQPERWVQRSIKVTTTTAPLMNITKKLPIQINPWEPENFSWDCRSGKPPRGNGGKSAQLNVADVSYAYIGQDFELNRYLNLTFKRKYQIRMAPTILRQTAFDKRILSEALNDGQYHLRMLVLAPTDATNDDSKVTMSSYKYLTSYEGTVHARGGVINEEVTLPFDFQDIPFVAGRNRLVVELAPAGRSSLRPITVSSQFNAVSETGGSGALLSTQSAQEISERLAPNMTNSYALARAGRDAKARRSSTKEAPSTLYRKSFGLRELTAQDISRISLYQSDVDALVVNPKSSTAAAAKFCGLLFADTSSISRCRGNAAAWLNVFGTQHVESILSRPAQRGTNVYSISVNANMSHDSSASRTTSTGTNESTNVNVGAKVGIGFGKGKNDNDILSPIGLSVGGGVDFSVSHGWSWFTTRQVSHSKGRSSSLALTFGRSLSAEALDFSFEAQVRKCVVIAPRVAGAKAGYHICPKGAVSRGKYNESWYYISQTYSAESSPLRDAGNINNRPWLTVLRGKGTFNRFRSMIEDSTSTVAIVPNSEFEELNRALKDPAQRFVNTAPQFNEGAFPAMLGN